MSLGEPIEAKLEWITICVFYCCALSSDQSRTINLILYVLIVYINFRKAAGSYLDSPRIHFAGQYRADVNSRNNCPCNYDPGSPIYESQEWNYQGTNEWEFVDTVVTAVIGNNGEEIPGSPLLGAKVFSNENRPFGKIVDMDVDFQVSSLYGLEFGLKYNNISLFTGKWSTSVIVHDMWVKMKCTNRSRGLKVFGAQSTTRVTDVAWSQLELISDLKTATEQQNASGDLSVSINLDTYSADIFTMGRVYGTIGIAMVGEPLNVGGERKMEPDNPGSLILNFTSGTTCYGINQDVQKPWVYSAPFKVDYTRGMLIVDFGNALPIQENGDPMNLGTLYFGILVNGLVQPFGVAIPYTDSNSAMWRHSGIFKQSVGSDIANSLQNSKLVVFIDSTAITRGNGYLIQEAFPSIQSNEMVSVLLSEIDYFVRPMDYYQDRLEYLSGMEEHPVKSSSNFTLLVTRLGQPVSNVNITVIHSYNQAGQPVLPHGAVAPIDATKPTDSNGHVTFTFTVNQPIPKNRSYLFDACFDYKQAQKANMHGKIILLRRAVDQEFFNMVNIKSKYNLTINSNLYNFYYCVGESCTLPYDGGFFLCKALISILAFSTETYKKPYTWVDHVEPIFKQVYHLNHIMRTILNMSNYTDVTLPHNIELLKMALLKPTSDPNYMPTTRDLSPTNKWMIMAWLEDPIYSRDQKMQYYGSSPVCNTLPLSPKMRRQNFSHFHPPRCLLNNIPFNTHPSAQDSYFHKIMNFSLQLNQDFNYPPRALFGLGFDKENIHVFNNLVENGNEPVCNISNLRKQLQNAVLLEFSTLPLYLTSMYSIVENCNTDAYQTMRGIVMQEMLHFVQASNILIAVGGEVIIDHPNHVPSYPSTGGLPGGVLPGLDLSLEKFTLRHVYDTMLPIETPMLTYVARPDSEFTLHTMGQLYKEISLCTHILGDSIFDPMTVDYQVQWPWTETDNIGTLYIITDGESAQNAINQIMEQGEGLISSHDVAMGQYSHFYRFEEIVCQGRLIQTEEEGYAYAGAPIEYNPEGVYPMRDNPSSDTIVPNTDCYTEAKAFHRAYRSFLHVLQETFSGEPHKIHQSVELMEALQVHAKRCMWTPYGKGNTCGPVWDYEWK